MVGVRQVLPRLARLLGLDQNSLVTRGSKSSGAASALKALAGLSQYKSQVDGIVERLETLFFHQSLQDQRFGSKIGYKSRIDRIRHQVEPNTKVLSNVASMALEAIENEFGADIGRVGALLTKTSGKLSSNSEVMANLDLNNELLHMIMRDWTVGGEKERQVLFSPIVKILKTESAKPEYRDKGYRILLPGSGLARLGFDIVTDDELSKRGLHVEANEMSCIMHWGAQYILSRTRIHSEKIRPFATNYSHQMNEMKTMRTFTFPDVAPAPKLASSKPSSLCLVYGDFTNPIQLPTMGGYQSIVTLFFIDTAQDICKYLQTIWDRLEMGGIWINSGPLKWGTAPFMVLNMHELLLLVQLVGFDIESQWTLPDPVGYHNDYEGLYNGYYTVVGWVARKV